MMHKRLMAELPLLREQVREAQAADNPAAAPPATSSSKKRKKKSYINANSTTASSSSGAFNLVNANVSSPRNASQAVSQFFSALEYRRSHQVGPSTAAGTATTAAAAGGEAVGLKPTPAAAEAAVEAEAFEVASASNGSAVRTGTAAAASAAIGLAGGMEAVPAAAAMGGAIPAGLSRVLIERITAAGGGEATHGPGSQQLSTSYGHPAAAALGGAAAAATAAAAGGASPTPAAAAGKKVPAAAGGDHVNHLVESASNTAAPASRVSSAALAALEYKRQKAAGKAQPAAGLRTATAAQLAPLLAAAPAPPPAPTPGAASAAGVSTAGTGVAVPSVLVGAVETAKFDVYAHKKQQKLDDDVRMDVLLNGVAGGLGAQAPLVLGSSSPAASTSSSSSGRMVPGIGAESRSSSRSGGIGSSSSSGLGGAGEGGQGAAVIITAKFDPYSGRRRKVQEEGALDEYLAGLAAASTALAVEQGLIDSQEMEVKVTARSNTSSSSRTSTSSTSSSSEAIAEISSSMSHAPAGGADGGVAGAVVVAGESGKVDGVQSQKTHTQQQQQKVLGGSRSQQQQRPQGLDPLCGGMLPGDVLPVPT